MKNKFLPRVVAASFLLQILMTWKLWFPIGRTYPHLPLFDYYDFSFLFTPVLVGLLVWLIFFFEQQIVSGLLVCLALLVASDLTRLQVWVWFYVLALLIWQSCPNEKSLKNRQLWLFAAVYFWGGFNKLNPYFQEDIFSWWCESSPFLKFLAGEKWAAVAAALLEMSLAVGILFQGSRRFFGWLAIAFHLLNVLMLSPLALNWNLVVVPWNLVMAVLIWWICLSDGNFFSSKNEDLPATSLRIPAFDKSAAGMKTSTTFVMLLAWLAPALNFVGWFPHNLSWKMYAGTHSEATFFFSPAEKIELPAAVSAKIFEGEGELRLTLDDWANEELGVPPFSTEFALKKAGKCLCNNFGHEHDTFGFYLLTIENQFQKGTEKLERITCETFHED